MKRFILAMILLTTLLLGTSRAFFEQFEKQMKHAESSMNGLNRVITWYAPDGKTARVWEGKIMVEMQGSVACFILNGKEYKISGSYIIEEK